MTDIEPLDEFRARARDFIQANLGPLPDSATQGLRKVGDDAHELRQVARDRELQRMLFDAGLAGVIVPTEYGGQGLTPAHQQVLNEEMTGREYPVRIQIPTFTPCMAVLLEFAPEEFKQQHIPAILRGDELWMQFLSEPSGGSDVAGALTTAVRDGDEWILNGSKVWTTGAWWSDWGLCLARTNWDVPKHRGLSVFVFPIHSEGIEVQRIEMLNGNMDFCQEFLEDLRVPDHHRIGEVDDGWTVGTRWMFHERMAFNSPLVTHPVGTARARVGGSKMRAIAADAGTLDDARSRELIGEAEMLALAGGALERRISEGIATGTMSGQASAIARLHAGRSMVRRQTIAFDLAGAAGGAWTSGDGELAMRGDDFLMRQISCIGGGTTEMAANVVAERVLGFPRERSLDRDVAFRDVPRSASGNRATAGGAS